MREDSSLEGSFDLTTMRLQFILWIYDLTFPSRGLIFNVFILAWGLIMASSCSKSLGTVDPQLFRHSCTSPPPLLTTREISQPPFPVPLFQRRKTQVMEKNRIVSNLLKKNFETYFSLTWHVSRSTEKENVGKWREEIQENLGKWEKFQLQLVKSPWTSSPQRNLNWSGFQGRNPSEASFRDLPNSRIKIGKSKITFYLHKFLDLP